MSRLNEVRAERKQIVDAARAILAKAEAEKRGLTAEEQASWDSHMAKQNDLLKAIETEERMVEAERSSAATAALNAASNSDAAPGVEEIRAMSALFGRELGAADVLKLRKQRDGFRAFLRGQTHLMTPEFRALQVDVDTSGGFLVAPEQFVAELIVDVANEVVMRQPGMARQFRVANAQSLGAPTLTRPSNASWTAEIQAAPEDTTMAFGKRNLFPHPLSKLIKVSRPLMMQALMSPETLVRSEFAYIFGITEETAFMTGNGSAQPLGVFTASNFGISTGRDLSTDNTTTAIAADNLIGQTFNIKGQYRAKSTWVFHRDAMSQITKLKGGDGQYLWLPSMRDGAPDTLLGRPVKVSEYAPNTFTTGLYVGILGDFSHYWIADSVEMGLQRLDELYAVNNQVGFIGRKATDGMPVLENAFTRVKLG